MNKIALNILIITTILINNGCMTTKGIDYNPSNNTTDEYVSISERNFQIWLKNQKPIGGNKGFYAIAPCPNNMGHGEHR
jgi:hypothetical protein